MEKTTVVIEDWQTMMSESLQNLLAHLINYLPQIFGALFLLLAGWLLATLLSKVTHSLLVFFQSVSKRVLPASLNAKTLDIKPLPLQVLSKIVYWVVLLFFVATAGNTIGLDFFASTLGQVVTFLPRVLAGAIIIFGGFIFGSIAGAMVRSTLASSGVSHAAQMTVLVKYAIVFTALVIGIEQIGIDMHFVTNLAITLAGVLVAGIALAFGLGTHEFITNVVAARQTRKHFEIKETISIAGVEGVLIDITGTMLVIENEQGKSFIPAKQFLNQPSAIAIKPAAETELAGDESMASDDGIKE